MINCRAVHLIESPVCGLRIAILDSNVLAFPEESSLRSLRLPWSIAEFNTLEVMS
jgi:hypothetical protein